jgi:hypothetical protein
LSGLAAFCSAAALLVPPLNPYQGSFLTARMLRKMITADLLAANADLSDRKKTNALRLFHFYERCKKSLNSGCVLALEDIFHTDHKNVLLRQVNTNPSF